MSDPMSPQDEHVDGAYGFDSTEQEVVVHRLDHGRDVYLRGMLYLPLGVKSGRGGWKRPERIRRPVPKDPYLDDPDEIDWNKQGQMAKILAEHEEVDEAAAERACGDEQFGVPCVVCAHALNADLGSLVSYAIPLAERGFAALTFDFFGARGSGASGETARELTVETQERDLEAVFDYLASQPWCNPKQMFLLAEANGVNSAILFAADNPDRVRGMALMYPMAQLHDQMVEAFGDGSSVPKTFTYEGTLVSDKFALEAIWRDPIESAAHYPGKTLVVHGSEDTVTPLVDAARLADAFPNRDFMVIEGAGHDFMTSGSEVATERVVGFFNSLLGADEDD